MSLNLAYRRALYAVPLSLGVTFAAQAQDVEPIDIIANDIERSFQCDMDHSAADPRDMLDSVYPATVFIQISPAVELPDFIGPPLTPPNGQGRGEGNSLGSGFIIDPKQGLISTNAHVAGGPNNDGTGVKFDITLVDTSKRGYRGQTVTAELVGIDHSSLIDVALLKIDPSEIDGALACVQFADSDAVRVLDDVIAIGNPFGVANTVTRGVVSNARQINPPAPPDGRSNPYYDSIQTDSSINPGNSGGGLFNMKGKVIGMNTFILGRGASAGVGFAIPSNVIADALDRLNVYGEYRRGSLGVSIRDLNDDLAKDNGLSSTDGVLVDSVVTDSAAFNGGLKAGDIILSIDSDVVEDTVMLVRKIAETLPETVVDVTIMRDKEILTLPVTLDEKPKPGADQSNPSVIDPPEEFMPDEDDDADADADADKDQDDPDAAPPAAPPAGLDGP